MHKVYQLNRKLLSFVSIGLVILLFFISIYSRASAQANTTINFQGKIVNKSTGLNLVNGSPSCVVVGADTCDIRISIYDQSSGGTLLWREPRSNVELGDYDGIFSFQLNSVCASWSNPSGSCSGAGIDWGSDPTLYVEIEFDTDGNGDFVSAEVFARKELTSVPYAYYADVAGSLSGFTATDFVRFAPGTTQTTSSTNSLINIETTGNVSNPLILVNENGAGTADLLTLQVGGTNRFAVNNDGKITIGNATANSDYGLNIQYTYSGNSNYRSIRSQTILTGSSSGSVNGFFAEANGQPGSGNTITLVIGGESRGVMGTAGTVTEIRSIMALGQNQSTGTVGSLSGVYARIDNNSTGTIGNAYSMRVLNPNNASGTINNNYGLHIANQTAGTNDYGIYIAGADTYAIYSDDGINRFDGAVMIATTSSTANLNIGASDSTKAALRFISGSDPSSPNTGDLWWNGTNLYFKPSGSQVDLLAGGCPSCVEYAPASTQTTTSTNSLINLTSTATGATNPLLLVNENGTGTPNLLDLQVAGVSTVQILNNGRTGIGAAASSTSQLYIENKNASYVVLRLKAISGQATNIMEWQNSSGTVIGGISQNGNLFSNLGTSTSNLFFGSNAGNTTMTGITNIAIGQDALKSNTSGSGNTTVGYSSLATNTSGGQNTALGYNALLLNSTGSGNVALGYNAGAQETGSNKLYIDNSNTTNPLIYGDFDNNRVGISTTANTAFLNIAASTTQQASVRLVSSAGVNPSSPNTGDLWWNGTNLYFKPTGTQVDLLAGASCPTCILNGGNATGAALSIGSTDSQNVNFISGGATIMTIQPSGSPILVNSAMSSSTSSTSGSGDIYGLSIVTTKNIPGSTFTGSQTAGFFDASTNVGLTGTSVYGINSTARMTGSGILSGLYGGNFSVSSTNGNVTNAYAVLSSITTSGSGGITSGYLFRANNTTGAGSISAQYGLYIENLTSGTGGDYGIYIAGADTYAIFSDAGLNRFDGNVLIGTTTSTANLNIGASGSTNAAIRFISGTNPSSPNAGELWWNGTNLYFKPTGTQVDLLTAGSCPTCLLFAPASTQSTTSTNSLINITSTATSATNPLILANENGTGTPDLLDLQVAGTSKFEVNNSGRVGIATDANASYSLNIIDSFALAGTSARGISNTITATSSGTNSTLYGSYQTTSLNGGTNNSNTLYGSLISATLSNTPTNAQVTGMNISTALGSGNTSGANLTGIYSQISATSGTPTNKHLGVNSFILGNTTLAMTYAAFQADYNNSSNTNIETFYGFYVDSPGTYGPQTSYGMYVSNTATTTTHYGIYLENNSAPTDYGIYIAGADTYAIWSDAGLNRFDGNVMIGTTTSTAFLTLGYTGATYAPLRFMSNSDPSSLNSGDIWANNYELKYHHNGLTMNLVPTLQNAYYNDLSKIMNVNTSSGLQFQATSTGNIVVNLQSTSHFLVQDNGTNTFWVTSNGGIITNFNATTNSSFIMQNDGVATTLNISASTTANGLSIDYSGTGTTSDAIIIANNSTGAITDAIDVSDAEIINAINLGQNNIVQDDNGTVNWNDSSGNNLIQIKDLSTQFGATVEAGAMISRNSYFGEEFNRFRATISASTLNGWGDYQHWTFQEETASTQDCTMSYVNDAANGISRMGNTQLGAGCALYDGRAVGTPNLAYYAANRPVVIMKVRPGFVSANDDTIVGLASNVVLGGTNPPTSGIYFTNNDGTTWTGVTRTSTAAATNVVCTGTTVSTTNFALLKIEVISTSEVRFYVDPDVSDGVSWFDCGSSTTNIPTVGLSTVVQWISGTAGRYIDLDYFRVWQDDAVIQEPVAPPSTPVDNNSETPTTPDDSEDSIIDDGKYFDLDQDGLLTLTTTKNITSIKFTVPKVIFESDLIVSGAVEFMGDVIISGNLAIGRTLGLGSDFVGTVVIEEGMDIVEVKFKDKNTKEYVVSVSSIDSFIRYTVLDKTENGFKIKVENPVIKAEKFDWVILSKN